jgi:RNA polymerase sigma-70 factor (ECF subfamily)
MMTEYNLIQKVAKKDSVAFRKLVENHQSRVVSLAFRFARNRQDAEDIAQEVFLNIWKKAGKFRGDADPSTWIYRITVNTALNYLRSRKKDDKLVSEEALQYETASPNDQPDHILDASNNSETLYEALDELPEKLRIPFMLNKMEELSYQQVADTLKLSLSNVQTRIFRAKKKLQEILVKKLRD